jgi:pimeloyl-ACP methyl ester carboxylesterase
MTTRLHFDDELYDAQLVRALAYTAHRGADLGECLATAARITRVDGELWHAEWRATAERAEQMAAESQAAGRRISARDAWLRASNYHRTSGLFLIGPDERFRDSIRRQRAAFRKANELFDLPATPVQIPYESTSLPGYLFRATDGATARPLLIVTDGYDGTIEELYFAAASAALERGYDVLVFDGPGQGSVITEQSLPFRPDWENVVTPVVDFALTLDGVDPDRIALMGWSFGGYLAPRAATAEPRLAACISDSGPYDLRAASLDRIPGVLARRYEAGSTWAARLLERILARVANKPTTGWGLRRNLYVHGLTDPIAYLEMSRDYSLRGLEQNISCPTLVCTTEGDDVSARATELAAALTCPHELVVFKGVDGVSGHCEMTGRAQFHRRAFDWLDHVLHTVGEPASEKASR